MMRLISLGQIPRKLAALKNEVFPLIPRCLRRGS